MFFSSYPSISFRVKVWPSMFWRDRLPWLLPPGWYRSYSMISELQREISRQYQDTRAYFSFANTRTMMALNRCLWLMATRTSKLGILLVQRTAWDRGCCGYRTFELRSQSYAQLVLWATGLLGIVVLANSHFIAPVSMLPPKKSTPVSL